MAATTQPLPFVRDAAEGDRRSFAGGGVHRWLATSAETDGAFLLFEDDMAGGKATPLHSHPTAESLYLLEGEIVVHLDGVDHRLSAGGFATAPAGVPHAFMVVSDAARILFLHTPGPAQSQAFYMQASDPLDPGDEPGEADFARVRSAAQDTGGMTLLGAPPFAPR
ncbi:MAG: cupin protein [Rhodoglobus sp.]|nr:cupin protein [Rhodoglobus sp.]